MPSVALAAAGRLPIKKAVYIGMLPRALSYADRFKLARDTGFEEVECDTATEQKLADEIKKAAESAGIRIHSVMNQAHWEFPLSSSDPHVVAESLKGMETSLRNANFWGAGTVLLVPAVVNPQTSYKDAYERSQMNIHKLLALAQELKVVIGLENVRNKFLLSPLEFAAYVDSFKSPWVRAYFDVGNVVLFGYPQDWIRTLGKRIMKVHLKDFKVTSKGFSPFTADFVNLGEGDVAWPEVRAALGEVGYSGTVIAELGDGELPYLKDVAQRIDRLLGIA